MPFVNDILEAIELRQSYDEIVPFWFVLDSLNPYGPNNIGVSGRSVIDVAKIIDTQLPKLMPILGATFSQYRFEMKKVVPNINLCLLDSESVLSHIGDPKKEGIWWPRLD